VATVLMIFLRINCLNFSPPQPTRRSWGAM